MLAAIEYDEEGMPGAIDFAHELDLRLKELLNDIQSGEYEFKDEDLPFVSVLQGRQSFMMPFHDLLQVINETHRKGLMTEEE